MPKESAMTLALRRFESPEEFTEATMLYLLRHESEHCLIIGLVAQAIENPHRWDGPVSFATVEREGVPVAAAIRTPPHNPILSRVSDPDAIPLLVDLFAADQDVRGVMAPAGVSGVFAEAWALRTGDAVTLAM